jgi:hypothetical protein
MVLTPATEHCVTSSVSAIRMNCIPSIQGSAYSGKSETVKEASRLMGKVLVSFFCTEELRISVVEFFLRHLPNWGLVLPRRLQLCISSCTLIYCEPNVTHIESNRLKSRHYFYGRS